MVFRSLNQLIWLQKFRNYFYLYVDLNMNHKCTYASMSKSVIILILCFPPLSFFYLGIEDEHSRKELDTDYHAQCFLHYVDKNGPNKMFVKDKRQLYGMPYNAN